jgi:hypothetical protein
LNQVTYAAKTLKRVGLFSNCIYAIRCRLRYREDCFKIEIMKKTFPGSADSGRVPAKIFNIAVGPFYNRRKYRLVTTAINVKNKLLLGRFYMSIAGENLASFPLAIRNQKIRKTKHVQCLADFLIKVLGDLKGQAFFSLQSYDLAPHPPPSLPLSQKFVHVFI